MSSGRAAEPSNEMARERHNSSIRSRKVAMREGKKHSAGNTNLLKNSAAITYSISRFEVAITRTKRERLW